jgi:hypothetical protein
MMEHHDDVFNCETRKASTSEKSTKPKSGLGCEPSYRLCYGLGRHFISAQVRLNLGRSPPFTAKVINISSRVTILIGPHIKQ